MEIYFSAQWDDDGTPLAEWRLLIHWMRLLFRKLWCQKALMHAGARCVFAASHNIKLISNDRINCRRTNVNKQKCQTEANVAMKRTLMLLFSLEFMQCHCVLPSSICAAQMLMKLSNFADVDCESGQMIFFYLHFGFRYVWRPFRAYCEGFVDNKIGTIQF